MLRVMAPTTRKRTPMSKEHKAALAEGRDQGRAVRRYLEALEANKPRRGRKRSPESMKRLHLVQERLDLQSALDASESNVDLAQLEKDFVKSAAPYSERKSISYSAWRELGVPTHVLDKAGITRGS